MAQIKITDLQLRSLVSDTCNFVVDDGTQSYRVTALQLFNYLLPKFVTPRTISAAANDVEETDRIVLLDPTVAPFTQLLPDATTFPEGVYTFKNIALPSNGNAVTLTADGAQKIDNDSSIVLNSSPSMDSVDLLNTGTGWLII